MFAIPRSCLNGFRESWVTPGDGCGLGAEPTGKMNDRETVGRYV
jgi:hypothetical protein